MNNIVLLIPLNAGRKYKLPSHVPLQIFLETPSDWGSESASRRDSRRSMPSVFIIDDQFTGRKILEELVRSVDSELAITSFADSYEALRYAGRQAPDLILTDYR